MSIAMSLIGQVLDVAARNNAQRIDEVVLEVGFMRQVVPEAMQMAWEAVTEDTPALGSVLTITEVPPEAECRKCRTRFVPRIDCFLCPGCGQADVEIITGDDIVLKSMSCEVDDGEAVQ
jgi:hydrogenase nickel incorporation protein HypA/HybF